MILNPRLPYDISDHAALPGVAPVGDAPWFIIDDAYAAQMQERQRLLRDRRADVVATDAPNGDALAEMVETVLAHLPAGFERTGDTVTCPDGRRVEIAHDDPFETLGRIVPSDVCLLEKRGDEHVLTGAVLCFPASWRLAEKIGRPLTGIHTPVAVYTPDLARRVQRLFDGVRPERPIWRFNALWYDDPSLFQPRSASNPRPLTDRAHAPYLRSERQIILRLPRSNAAVFLIQTFVLARESVPTG